MEKKFFLIMSLTLIPSIIYGPHRHSLNIEQITDGTEITKNILDRFYDTKYQKQYKHLQKITDEFTHTFNNFHHLLTTFAKQPLKAAKNGTSIEQLSTALHAIKQKPLLIAITKLLQFKKSTSAAQVEQANKLLASIRTTLQKTQNAVTELNAKNLPEFNQKITTPFTFKVRKIKRALTNWDND